MRQDSYALTKAYGAFASGLCYGDLPAQALRIACTGFVDCLGVMLAGSTEDAVTILHDTLDPSPGSAALVTGKGSASSMEAALINATAAHALDYDDVALGSHPSAVLVPAILAEAQSLDLSGKDMLTAYLAGYEVWADLVAREPESLHTKGWHPTGIYGAVAAAAACASLHRLDAGRATHAIGIGASQGAGLMANFGSMTKPLHCGRAAQAGILAARLAGAGFTSAPDALEHAHGLLRVVSPSGRARLDGADAIGQVWRILSVGLSIKRYPTCYSTHRPIDAMLDLVEAHAIAAPDVQGIEVSLSETFHQILRNHRPESALAAKFSVEFALAGTVIAQRMSLKELTDDFVRRPDVQRLMTLVSIHTNTDYDAEFPGASRFDQVRVALKDGRVLESEPVARPLGHAQRPMSEAELFDKFSDCAAAAMAASDAQALLDRLRQLDQIRARELSLVNAFSSTL